MKHKKLIQVILVVVLFIPFIAFAGEWTWQNPLPQGHNLRGLWGGSGTDVFAVGDGGTILHYNGSTWINISNMPPSVLNDVWGISATSVYTVGMTGSIMHSDGTRW